jgi:hypothetical protein
MFSTRAFTSRSATSSRREKTSRNYLSAALRRAFEDRFGDAQAYITYITLTAMRRDKRRRGYFVSFAFSEDAMKEIRRLDKEGELEIIPVTVKELLNKSGFEIASAKAA